MSIANEVIKAEVENAYELKRLEWKVTQQQIIQALQSADNEIEYQNLFWTMQKALPKLNSDNREQEVDKDKMKRLKDLSKEFSSDDMQEVVAGILAWEYNQPGSFSLQTMSIVRNLSREDITLFQRFLWFTFNGQAITNELFKEWENFKHMWVSYADLMYLETLGLISWKISAISYPPIDEFGIPADIGWKKISLRYLWAKKLNNLSLITHAWREIAPLLTPIFNQYAYDRTVECLNSYEFEVLPFNLQ